MLFFLILGLGLGQWLELRASSPANVEAGPMAQIPPLNNPVMWCNNDVVYVFGHGGQIWIYEKESKRWLWQPNTNINYVSNTPYWVFKDQFYWHNGDKLYLYDIKTRGFVEINGEKLVPGHVFWVAASISSLFMVSQNQLYQYPFATGTWTAIQTLNMPNFTSFAPAIADTEHAYVYYDGFLWGFDFKTLQWTILDDKSQSIPPARQDATLWQATPTNLLLYGGVFGGKFYGDLWSFNLVNKNWESLGSLSGPSPRAGFSTCQTSTSYLFLFGGTNDAQPVFNDMWQYGPFTTKTIVDQIDWKLDSATLMATWGAAMSTICFVCFVLLMLGLCVRRCLNRKRDFTINTPLASSSIPYVNEF